VTPRNAFVTTSICSSTVSIRSFSLSCSAEHLRAEREEPGGGQAVAAFAVRFVAGAENIARDLHGDEAVVGEIRVQGADDPIAIAPRIREREILVDAVRIGITGDVEPLAREAFAIGFGCQESVHHARVRVLGRVGEGTLGFHRASAGDPSGRRSRVAAKRVDPPRRFGEVRAAPTPRR
jgi:hypothetical protein